MTPLPVPTARFAAVPGGRIEYIRPDTAYASTPPALLGFRCDHPPMARSFLSVLARPQVACPAEAVMIYPDALLLDGKHVIARDGTGVAESFADAAAEPWHPARVAEQLAQAARGDIPSLPPGPPAVAACKAYADNFGHIVVETMPKLLHLAAMELRHLRLLLPEEACRHGALLTEVAARLGLAAEIVPCPPVLRVPELFWPSPVARYPEQASPSLLHLLERFAPSAPAGPSPRLYIARPPGARRAMRNAAAIEAMAMSAGFAVVEPSRLSFTEQVALFAGARVVLGPMGAGLTLAAAMRPGGRLAMLDPGTSDLFFWNLACLAGLSFDWAFTAPVLPGNEAAFSDPMAVPPPLMTMVLDALGTA